MVSWDRITYNYSWMLFFYKPFVDYNVKSFTRNSGLAVKMNSDVYKSYKARGAFIILGGLGLVYWGLTLGKVLPSPF